MAERFTIERRHTGLALYDQEAFLTWVCDDEAIALRDLLNREFPQGQERGISQLFAEAETNDKHKCALRGSGISFPEIDEFNAETWRLDEEAAHARRRERVATAVLAAILSTDAGLDAEIQQASRAAVQHADALLAALDQPRP